MHPNIHRIRIPTPFSIGPVNIYLLEGDPLTLVDLGPKTPEALQALEAGLARHGYRMSDIQQIIITHRHNDHFGLTATVRAAGDPIVIAARIDREYMEDAHESWLKRNRRLSHLLKLHGLPASKQAEIDAFFARTSNITEGSRIDRPVDDGDVVFAGSANWHVVHTPGHCAGHICLYQAATKVLISGDHLLSKVSSNPLVEPATNNDDRPRTLWQYIHSLHRTGDLEVSEVLPGHGPIIVDHRSITAERIAFHDKRKEAIRVIVGDGAMTAYEISKQLFRGLADDGLFLGMSEVIGHLDLLEMDGVLEIVPRDGVLHYRMSSLVPSAQ